jgi:hypothetical protein
MWPAVLACAGFLAACAVLAGILLWPSKGTLIVETDDADAELILRSGSAIVRDRTKDREIALRPGTYTAELAVPRPGLRLSPTTFEITKTNQTRVRVIAEKPAPAEEPDRRAAEYVLSAGGSVRVNADERDITALVDLPRGRFTLARVNLSGRTAVTDASLAVLRGCAHLTYVILDGTSITDAGVRHFKDCPALTVVALHKNAVSDAGLALLKERTTMTYLYLAETRITSAGLAALANHKNLRLLDMNGTAVTDEGLKFLFDCRGLVELKLAQTGVTRAGVEGCARALPWCRIEWNEGAIEPAGPDRRAAEYALSVGGRVTVDVNGKWSEVTVPADLPQGPFRLVTFNGSRNPRVTDTGLIVVRECRHLQGLFLNESPNITDAGLAHFAGCTSLKRIDIYNSKMTDAGLAAFKDCKDLGHLGIDGTGVTDAGLALFKDCPLGVIAVSRTPITDAGLAHFKGLTGLTYLDVHQTQVTDAGLAPFKEHKTLTRLFIKGTKVTRAKVAELADALPRCRIDSDFGTFGPEK